MKRSNLVRPLTEFPLQAVSAFDPAEDAVQFTNLVDQLAGSASILRLTHYHRQSSSNERQGISHISSQLLVRFTIHIASAVDRLIGGNSTPRVNGGAANA